MIDEKPLDRRLFQARPDTPFRGEPLTLEQETLFLSIVGASEAQRRGRPRNSSRRFERLSLAAALLAVLLLLGTALSAWHEPTSPAVAATPRIVQAHSLKGEARELLMDLSQSIGGPGHAVAPHTIRFQFWSLAFSPDAPPKSVQPQEMLVEYLADGRKLLESRALQPRSDDGKPVDDPEAYDVDEMVFRHTFEKDEPVGLFPKPSADAEWGELLREGEGLPANASAAGYFRAVSNLLSEHPLSRSEQSGLLRFLATLSGIRVEGQVVDRLGRPGVSFSAPDGEYRRVLIISPTRGVLAYESLYTGSDRTDIPSPAVIDYKAWHSPNPQRSDT